jgi:hypothetical protein
VAVSEVERPLELYETVMEVGLETVTNQRVRSPLRVKGCPTPRMTDPGQK